MSWLPVSFGKLSDLSDIADSFNKLSESVKNIELNFDTALGFENTTTSTEKEKEKEKEKEQAKEETQPSTAAAANDHSWSTAAVSSGLYKAASTDEGEENKAGKLARGPPASSPRSPFSANRKEASVKESSQSSRDSPSVEEPVPSPSTQGSSEGNAEENETRFGMRESGDSTATKSSAKAAEDAVRRSSEDADGKSADHQKNAASPSNADMDGAQTRSDVGVDADALKHGAVQGDDEEEPCEGKSGLDTERDGSVDVVPGTGAVDIVVGSVKNEQEEDMRIELGEQTTSENRQGQQGDEGVSLQVAVEASNDSLKMKGATIEPLGGNEPVDGVIAADGKTLLQSVERQAAAVNAQADSAELENLRKDLQMMEIAVQGAAKQAQAKADELSRIMILNDNLRSELAELKNRNARDAEMDVLKEEFHMRLGAAERKVYALTKERDMLKREQSKKMDTSTLLKEKDEIIKQVMAEGEELSKKQAGQELTMKKLRVQIRELEDEKQRLISKAQVEEARVESMRIDKEKTERELQEAVQRGKTELAAQKELYANAVAEWKDAVARAESKADSEAKVHVEKQLKESLDREQALIRTVDELREAMTCAAQQAGFREDTLCRDVEDLQRRCQAAEQKHEELVGQMPDSTRPLLRQIEALQESLAVRTDAWKRVEHALNARLRGAEVAAALAQEKEQMMNERLTQTTSRLAVMEAQLSCLKAEHAQLSRALEKERQRAQENRQEYLAASEAAAAQECRAKQLEEEIRELRIQHRKEVAEERSKRETTEKEIEREKMVFAEHEKRIRAEGRTAAEKAVANVKEQQQGESRLRALSRVVNNSGSVEESVILQASLQGSPVSVASPSSSNGAIAMSSMAVGGRMMTKGPSTLEQMDLLLRQKEGELVSYAARLAGLESTRDSLAEELVKSTTQCESYKTEASSLPGLRAELEALRKRHASALELMGERDEQVEELRADLADIKQMYREQIDMLVNQIERMSAQLSSSQSIIS